MKESLVQWTLLNNQAFLSECLNFSIAKKIGQEITTEFGRLDFVLENNKKQQLIVELETTLDSSDKLNYCFNQVLNYRNVRFIEDTKYCILFAKETSKTNTSKIEKFGKDNDVLIRSYSLNTTKELYSDTVERLSLNIGLALPNPKNYTICFLRWLHKILKPFHDFQKQMLTFDEIFSHFTGRTNFNCYKRLALDFEMITEKNDVYYLTTNGKDFIDNFNPYVFKNSYVSSIDLTNEQKRLLLKILTNGTWDDKIHKMNIYWFLRFLEVTNGDWLPKRFPFEKDKLEIARGLFKVSYSFQTMQQFLNWCCNYCEELGLVERIKSTTSYDRLILTPLGVEVNNIFSMDMILKKSRMNLSFKYAE
jgi:hypothetical protein